MRVPRQVIDRVDYLLYVGRMLRVRRAARQVEHSLVYAEPVHESATGKMQLTGLRHGIEDFIDVILIGEHHDHFLLVLLGNPQPAQTVTQSTSLGVVDDGAVGSGGNRRLCHAITRIMADDAEDDTEILVEAEIFASRGSRARLRLPSGRPDVEVGSEIDMLASSAEHGTRSLKVQFSAFHDCADHTIDFGCRHDRLKHRLGWADRRHPAFPPLLVQQRAAGLPNERVCAGLIDE